MVNVSLCVSEGPVICRVRVRAATLRKALALAGYGRPNRVVSVHGPAPASRILAADLSKDRAATTTVVACDYPVPPAA